MCENCKTILFDYRGKPHDPLTCPLLDIAYCGICSKRGHFHVDCPDTLVQRFRKPQYLEELIPPSLKEKYKIHTTRTPLVNNVEPVSPIIPISMWDTKKQVLVSPPFYPNIPPSMWEFPKNNAEYVKKFLVEHKATLDKLGLKVKENKIKNEEVLLKLAEHMNKIVVWTKSAKHTEKDEVSAQQQSKEPQKPKEPAQKKRSHKKTEKVTPAA